jgi:hypothetical protein
MMNEMTVNYRIKEPGLIPGEQSGQQKWLRVGGRSSRNMFLVFYEIEEI